MLVFSLQRHTETTTPFNETSKWIMVGCVFRGIACSGCLDIFDLIKLLGYDVFRILCWNDAVRSGVFVLIFLGCVIDLQSAIVGFYQNWIYRYFNE